MSSSEQKILDGLNENERSQLSQLYGKFEKYAENYAKNNFKGDFFGGCRREFLGSLYLLYQTSKNKTSSEEEKYHQQRFYTALYWVGEQYKKQKEGLGKEERIKLRKNLFVFRVAYDLTHRNKLSPNFFWGLVDKIAIPRNADALNFAIGPVLIGATIFLGLSVLGIAAIFNPILGATLTSLMLPALKVLGGMLAASLGYAALAFSLPRVKDQFYEWREVLTSPELGKYCKFKKYKCLDWNHIDSASKDRHLRPFDSLGFFKHDTALSLKLPGVEELEAKDSNFAPCCV